MSPLKSLSVALCCSAIVALSGCCVGPMTCGPDGRHGPIAFGSSCGGCGDCDGCGELYIDPWINHPADACDPCDRCGNYSGQSCGQCRSVFDGFATLWGYRCDPPCTGCGVATCDGGCDAMIVDSGCDAGCVGCASCGIEPSEVIEVTRQPTRAKRIVEAVPVEAVPYQPSRTRKIFQPRPSIAVTPDEFDEF